jgi:iron complex transport system permease protein
VLGLAILAAAAACAFCMAICLGATNVPLSSVLLLLAGRAEDVPEIYARIITQIRLPRAIMGGCVGALLGCAGTLLQGFLRNPLAEPYLLGISSGAALAVTAVILLNAPLFIAGVYVVPVAAFFGALATLFVVYMLAQVRGRVHITMLVLAGVVVSAFLSAVIMLLAALNSHRYFEIISWLLGHLQPLTRNTQWWIAAYAGLGLAAAMGQSRDLNALLLGEEEAAALGVNVEKVKRTLFILSSLLTGVAVAASGLIGFVGLIAPHFSRMILGPDHRWLLPAASLTGAALLLLADLGARLLMAPTELPVGVITAIIGGPFFLGLLVRHARTIYGRTR